MLTSPVLFAIILLERSGSSGKGDLERLKVVIRKKEKNPDEILWVKELIDRTGAIEWSQKLADWHFNKGLGNIDGIPGGLKNSVVVKGLKEYASKLVYREF